MGIILEDYVSCNDIVTSNESLERNLREKEYLDYINGHILNVQKAFAMHFLPLLDKYNLSTFISDEELKNAINKAAIAVSIHDASKFDDYEFNMYRAKYYPTSYEKADPEYEEQAKERYEEAWKSHYEHNWHHPEYWFNHETGEKKDMTLDAIIEMICDWLSFSIKNNTSCREWYESNDSIDERNMMTDKTKQIVEEIIYKIIFVD